MTLISCCCMQVGLGCARLEEALGLLEEGGGAALAPKLAAELRNGLRGLKPRAVLERLKVSSSHHGCTCWFSDFAVHAQSRFPYCNSKLPRNQRQHNTTRDRPIESATFRRPAAKSNHGDLQDILVEDTEFWNR